MSKKNTGEIEESYNLYDELIQKYTQIYEKEKDYGKDISLLQKKIVENKSRNFMGEFLKRNSDRELSQENEEISEDSFPRLLQPFEERKNPKTIFLESIFLYLILQKFILSFMKYMWL